jgi:hypothetical protein
MKPGSRSNSPSASTFDPTRQAPPPPLFAQDLSPSLVLLETAVAKAPPPGDEETPPKKAPSSPSAHFHHFDGRFNLQAATPLEANFRHRHWANRRTVLAEVIAAMPMTARRMERWSACGGQAGIYYSKENDRFVVACLHCHDRFCWACATARSRQIARNLQKYIEKRQVRFLTLTLRSNNDPLTKQIDRLYRCFRTLRADTWWGNLVEGGAAFLEITLHPSLKTWHPHLHPVVSGRFIPQEVLSRKWLGVTGDSPIVHIKAVPDSKVVANYVCKYASKPMDDSVFADREKLSELVVSMAGRRMATVIGNWTKLKLTQHDAVFDPEGWRFIGSLTSVTELARRNDPASITVLNSLQRNLQWADITPPDPTDEELLAEAGF